MNRKSGSDGGYRPSFEGKAHRNGRFDSEKNIQTAASATEDDVKRPEKAVQRRDLPEPPPNYRGMIYDGFSADGIYAEGLSRLVENDMSYSEYEKNHKKSEPAISKSVSVTDGGGSHNCEDCNMDGLEHIVEGLESKRFSSEDILLCAMILLMLNSNSDDDILLVLVLMMLL